MDQVVLPRRKRAQFGSSRIKLNDLLLPVMDRDTRLSCRAVPCHAPDVACDLAPTHALVVRVATSHIYVEELWMRTAAYTQQANFVLYHYHPTPPRNRTGQLATTSFHSLPCHCFTAKAPSARPLLPASTRRTLPLTFFPLFLPLVLNRLSFVKQTVSLKIYHPNLG
jgi:hypothetical protein